MSVEHAQKNLSIELPRGHALVFTVRELKASEKTSLEGLFTVKSANNNLGTPIDIYVHTMSEAFITATWSNGIYKQAPSKRSLRFPTIYGINSNRNFVKVTKEYFLNFFNITFILSYQECYRYIRRVQYICLSLWVWQLEGERRRVPNLFNAVFVPLRFSLILTSIINCEKRLPAPSDLSGCPSVYSRETTLLPLGGFSWNFYTSMCY
jgi:hypothetical protein